MAKRRSASETDSLPLFDLPLQGEEEEMVDAAGPAAGAAPVDPLGVAPATEDDADDLELGDDEPLAALELGPAPLATAADDPFPAERPPATLAGRLASGLVDLGVQVAVLAIAAAVARAMGAPLGVDDAAAFLVFGLVFSFLYWVVPLAFWGQTPGMTLVGHLARSQDGEPLSFGQTTLRWIGALVTLTLLGLPLLLALGGRSFSDRVSGSHTLRLDR